MQVREQNISMIRGDSETLTVSCTDADGTALSFKDGDTVYFTVKKSHSTPEKILQKVIKEFTDGKAIIKIDSADTGNLSFQPYVYDIQWTRADGTVTTIVPKHTFTIEGEVTYE